MNKSHAAGWASDTPTPAQLKEFFAQMESGRITKDRLQEFLRGESRFKRDMAKERGWSIESDVGFNPAIRSIIELGLANFLNDDEQSVSGEELARRAKLLNANLGQKHAEWLLDHHEEIPEEWRGIYLVFPGTVWRRPDGIRYVPDLSWHGERWRLGFGWLDSSFRSGGRLLRSPV